jgi:uncharacterized protein with PIN domain
LNTFLRVQKCPVCNEGIKNLSKDIVQEKLNRKYHGKYIIISDEVDITSKTKILVNDNDCMHES